VFEKQDLLFLDDFQTVADSLWTPVTGTWGISSGAYRDSDNANARHYTHGGLTSWADIIAEGTVRFENPSGTSGNSGIVVRYIDSDNLIVARVRDDNNIELTAWENGTAEVLARTARSIAPNTTYPLRIVVEGPHITFDVDGTVINATMSPRFASAGIGLRSYGAEGVFDDIKVWRPGLGSLIDLTITAPLAPPGLEGAPYSLTVTAAGGTTPYTFSQVGGNLPAGMSVATDGTISGTPGANGTFVVHVQVTDSADRLRAVAVTFTILPATTGDTSPPAVVFVNPTDGQEVPANAEILQVDITDPSAVKLVDFRVNGSVWAPMTYMGADRYEIPLNLTEGSNAVDVRAEDYSSNSGISSITVELDTTPPILSLITYQEGALSQVPGITLDGLALDAVSVTVDGNPVTSFIPASGAWTHDVTLVTGVNTFTIVATDNFSRTDTLVVNIFHRLLGDVDGDGDVDEADALLTAQYEAGVAALAPIQISAADVDINGVVDIKDVYAIRRVAAGDLTFP
jgi:hypothetical protein